MIDAPEPFDVLLGRGKAIQKRPGNKLIRLLIDKNCYRYNQAPRQVKRAITNEIVEGIKSKIGKLPGRFLRLCGSAEQGEWKEVSNAVAIDKVSHIFRARRNLAQKSSSSGSLARMLETSAVAADDIVHHEKYAFTTPTNLLEPRLLLSNLQDRQHGGQPAARPSASVATISCPLAASVVMSPLLETMHNAGGSNSTSIIGAASSEDMMWAPTHQRRTRPELLQEPCYSQHVGLPARPTASVATASSPLPTSVVMLSPLKNMHYAASNSTLSNGALLSEDDMMWTPPPYQRRTRPEFRQESCHGEKGINDDLSSEDRAAAPHRPAAHYQDYNFSDHGSRSGNGGDGNSTTPR
jgi:hypothetical protein